MDPARALWQEWEQGNLSVQICDSCHATQHPPGLVCSHCYDTALHVQHIDGSARLLSWSTVYRAPSADFEGQVPYAVAIVSLSGGALMQVRVSPTIDLDEWRPGLAVELKLETIAGHMIPVITWCGPEPQEN